MPLNKENSSLVAGLMSGTSLDGLDICLVKFAETNAGWEYEIEQAETVAYPDEWIKKLLHAEKTSGAELQHFHSEYGKYLGECVAAFLTKHNCGKPEFVASHGHTIFHQPARSYGETGYTFQAGSGAALREACGIPVVCDFRTLDVALGGQGAPLVPIGDALLFGNYEYCLNLGGFANISFDADGKRIAYDICAVNYVMNRLAKRLGKEYDENGKFAASGKLIPEIFEKLNALPYFQKSPPKSIGREWVEETIFPMLPESEKAEDLLRTFTEHVAKQISDVVNGNGKMLVTGGGAHNAFLISLLKQKCKAEIVLPEKETINFKEALIFGFLGLLRWQNRINTLKSVTGARQDSSGGTVYY
ncbi:MAG: anhydro-N-acetylmuramic acid kinase [Bacteroidota bacterium]|nr:anhydro-N-acetylmuramic acid kinase [Bacteroidota bacterium]